MTDEVKDMKSRIHRLEDNMLRCKDFQEQIQIRYVLLGYRKHLQELILKSQNY